MTHTRLITAATITAALAVPAAAQASNGQIRSTVNRSASRITRDEGMVKTALALYPGSAPLLSLALGHEVRDLRSLRGRIVSERASSSTGAVARMDLIEGLGMIARSYNMLRSDVKAADGHAVAPAKVNAAVSLDRSGRSLLIAGLRTL